MLNVKNNKLQNWKIREWQKFLIEKTELKKQLCEQNGFKFTSLLVKYMMGKIVGTNGLQEIVKFIRALDCKFKNLFNVGLLRYTPDKRIKLICAIKDVIALNILWFNKDDNVACSVYNHKANATPMYGGGLMASSQCLGNVKTVLPINIVLGTEDALFLTTLFESLYRCKNQEYVLLDGVNASMNSQIILRSRLSNNIDSFQIFDSLNKVLRHYGFHKTTKSSVAGTSNKILAENEKLVCCVVRSMTGINMSQQDFEDVLFTLFVTDKGIITSMKSLIDSNALTVNLMYDFVCDCTGFERDKNYAQFATIKKHLRSGIYSQKDLYTSYTIDPPIKLSKNKIYMLQIVMDELEKHVSVSAANKCTRNGAQQASSQSSQAPTQRSSFPQQQQQQQQHILQGDNCPRESIVPAQLELLPPPLQRSAMESMDIGDIKQDPFGLLKF